MKVYGGNGDNCHSPTPYILGCSYVNGQLLVPATLTLRKMFVVAIE